MRLTVLSVAYPFAPVGRDASGGAEQVLAALDEALVAAGHRTRVIACAGSRVAGELIALPAPPDPIDDAGRARTHAAVRAAIAGAIPEADVVHLHGIDAAEYLPSPGPPALVTLHLPPAWYPASALRPERPNTFLACVSADQHTRLLAHLGTAETPAHVLAPIPNGVPVAALGQPAPAPPDLPNGFALVLGRLCPEKGQHVALEIAQRLGLDLLLAGALYPYPAHLAHFEAEIRPRLDARRRWLGPVGFAAKRALLQAARCLLVPSLAPETSSLVAMEAAACGCPVIAFPRGALTETVVDGRTGLLAADAEAMAAAIAHVEGIDPEACRAEARARFGEQRMAAAYLRRYHQLAAGAPW